MTSDSDLTPDEDDAASPEQSDDAVVFTEDAIEQAYLQALKASEEAGLMPELPDMLPLQEDEIAQSEAASTATEPAPSETSESSAPRLNRRPEQIVAALLFVGGEKLSARKIASLLGQHCTDQQVRGWVDRLNEDYHAQQRPYEITLGEDGYQMTLREAYEPIRHSLFGVGPREVKLSQDALEVLAMVAYQQPLTQAQILELDRPNVSAALRQLVRRELVAIERIEEGQPPVYRTTQRFLSLFGLHGLEDLPQTRNLEFK